MKVVDADHVNWRVRDLGASLRFYEDVLGLEPFGLERYRRGERSFFSVRVSPAFVMHLRVDPSWDPTLASNQDHLALVVEGVGLKDLKRRLEEAGVKVESEARGVIGARGEGEALYVRDPDGHLIELKLYGS